MKKITRNGSGKETKSCEALSPMMDKAFQQKRPKRMAIFLVSVNSKYKRLGRKKVEIKLSPEWENDSTVKHLVKLVEFAYGNTGQCVHIRRFLLHLYNCDENPLCLLEILRSIDDPLYESCMIVMNMRHDHNLEPQHYFENGSDIFKELWKMTYVNVKS